MSLISSGRVQWAHPSLEIHAEHAPATQMTLDTNVLVRLLTNDGPAQAQLAAALKLTQAAKEL